MSAHSVSAVTLVPPAADRLAAVLAAGLRLGAAPPPRQCVPIGQPFVAYQDATNNEDAQRHKFFAARGTACAICFEELTDPSPYGNPSSNVEALIENPNCGHVFHRACLSQYVTLTAGNTSCPVCKNAIAYEVLERMRERMDDLGAQKVFYANGRFGKRRVRIEYQSGNTSFFEGEKGAERLVRAEYPGGTKQFYEGEQGAERLVRSEFQSGQKQYYEGEKDAERKVRFEFPNGSKHFLEGEKGAERRVRVEFPGGIKQFFEGEKGAERRVRTEYPDKDTAAKRQRIAALAARERAITSYTTIVS